MQGYKHKDASTEEFSQGIIFIGSTGRAGSSSQTASNHFLGKLFSRFNI
jgi:hypothetical protein